MGRNSKDEEAAETSGVSDDNDDNDDDCFRNEPLVSGNGREIARANNVGDTPMASSTGGRFVSSLGLERGTTRMLKRTACAFLGLVVLLLGVRNDLLWGSAYRSPFAANANANTNTNTNTIVSHLRGDGGGESFQWIAFDASGTQMVSWYSVENASGRKVRRSIEDLLDGNGEGRPPPGVLFLGTGAYSPQEPEQEQRENLSGLSRLVDELLAPRLDWRLVAERFDPSEASLLYDPSMHRSSNISDSSSNSSNKGSSLIEPAIAARKTLLDYLQTAPGVKHEEDALRDRAIHYILVRATDPKIRAMAGALREHQFPSTRKHGGTFDSCEAWEDRTLGRVFVEHGGEKDFLGAWTRQNAYAMVGAIKTGVPLVPVLPSVWARVYRFEGCGQPEDTGHNAFGCGFLPAYGGECLSRRIEHDLECLSAMKVGPLQAMALPRHGIPSSVCGEARDQLPAPKVGAPFDPETYQYGEGPPDALREWCPSCNPFFRYESESQNPLPGWSIDSIADPDLPMGMEDVSALGRAFPELLPLWRHSASGGDRSSDINSDSDGPKTLCALEVPPLVCGDGPDRRVCCFDELTIPKRFLPTGNGDPLSKETNLRDPALSAFLTRFGRASRRRIAALHRPWWESLDDAWRDALSTGSCATLHIRRGDNISRCRDEGMTEFCSMDKTLDDYMERAVPMLEALGSSKHVFVMTDDPGEVTTARLAPWRERGYSIEAISGHNQYDSETYSDWDPFLESLHIAPSCRALVGHHISTVSDLVRRLSCFRWGECPLSDMFEKEG